ncbi:hypothetical protein SBF1_1290006 [Candidatus Desulfosporosinus infrequens]|uniref:Uncharacterized protein n=1 Tax=Candidatus Desulfosporosinus infrequens TaxID=2043169 RepID=A0A2U3K3L5_9FIRM|nr:hypothetical protein SBF1_1290006 [Candidatus Desulfosporosinus infrequens]
MGRISTGIIVLNYDINKVQKSIIYKDLGGVLRKEGPNQAKHSVSFVADNLLLFTTLGL